MCFLLGVEKEYLFTHPEKTISQKTWRAFIELLEKRKKKTPIAYLVQKKSFFGLEFFIDERVLIPRTETELLVEAALIELTPQTTLMDIGTGSGCVQIALVKNSKKNIQTFATDISKDALAVAMKNAATHHVETITFLCGDLLLPFLDTPSLLHHKTLLITANLPYLSLKRMISAPKDVRAFEPKLALFGGFRGLQTINRFLKQAIHLQEKLPKSNITLILELDPQQPKIIEKTINLHVSDRSVLKDYSGKNRVLILKMKNKMYTEK